MTTEPRDWPEFRSAGLLWFVNRILHVFGWAIVLEVDERGMTKKVYPARVSFLGFEREAETDGFRQTRSWMAREGPGLLARFETDAETCSECGLHRDNEPTVIYRAALLRKLCADCTTKVVGL